MRDTMFVNFKLFWQFGEGLYACIKMPQSLFSKSCQVWFKFNGIGSDEVDYENEFVPIKRSFIQ